MRQHDAVVRVAPQEVERSGAGRLVEGLGAQVRGADRVRLRDDRVTARLVTADRERQAEREQERDEAEQRPLKDADRLSLGLGPVMKHPPRHESGERRAEQDRDEKQCKLERAEAEEQGGLLDAEQARLSPRTASLPLPESLCLRVRLPPCLQSQIEHDVVAWL